MKKSLIISMLSLSIGASLSTYSMEYEKKSLNSGDTILRLMRANGHEYSKTLIDQILEYNHLSRAQAAKLPVGSIVFIPSKPRIAKVTEVINVTKEIKLEAKTEKKKETVIEDKVKTKQAALIQTRIDTSNPNKNDLSWDLRVGAESDVLKSDNNSGPGEGRSFIGFVSLSPIYKNFFLNFSALKSFGTSNEFEAEIQTFALAAGYSKRFDLFTVQGSVGLRNDDYDFTGIRIPGVDKVKNTSPFAGLRADYQMSEKLSFGIHTNAYFGGSSESENKILGSSLTPEFSYDFGAGIEYRIQPHYGFFADLGHQSFSWIFSGAKRMTYKTNFIRLGVGFSF